MAKNYDGYCEHGTYVGGCGADYMCHFCEMGYSRAEYQCTLNSRLRNRVSSDFLSQVFSQIADDMASAPASFLHPVIGVLVAHNKHRF